MSVTTRIAALHAAVSVPEVRDRGMGCTLDTADALDHWLTSGPVRVSTRTLRRILTVINFPSAFRFGRVFHNLSSFFQSSANVFTVRSRTVKAGPADLSVELGQCNEDIPNQIFTHTNSSSVGVDNSASEVATPARTKIIIPWQRLECMEGTGDGIVIVLKGAVA